MGKKPHNVIGALSGGQTFRRRYHLACKLFISLLQESVSEISGSLFRGRRLAAPLLARGACCARHWRAVSGPDDGLRTINGSLVLRPQRNGVVGCVAANSLMNGHASGFVLDRLQPLLARAHTRMCFGDHRHSSLADRRRCRCVCSKC